MEVIRVAEPAGAFAAADLSLAQLGVTCLLQELEAYPKPGLVSRVDSGAHADMDYDLMCRSSHALLHPFARICAAGRKASSFDDAIVPLGLAAEREMLFATGGINTHKGAIFTLGMILAALALTESDAKPVTTTRLRAMLLETWGNALHAHANSGRLGTTHGAMVHRTTGSGGARMEAARGFPSIFEIGVPAYREALASGLDPNACRVHTLFVLMEAVEDTNVIFRGGVGAADFVRLSARQFLREGGCHRDGWFERAEELHRKFIQCNLSPGGSADLLSGTILVAAASGTVDQDGNAAS